MDTVEISKCILLDSQLRKYCCGVYPVNKIPPPHGIPFGAIVNLDKDNEPGSHWTAFYVPAEGVPEYFDSYGEDLNSKYLQKYFDKHGQGIRYNNKRLQGEYSSACGQYSVYYLYHRVRQIPMDRIVHAFSRNYDHNDSVVTGWVNSKFDLKIPAYDIDFLVNQICRSMCENCKK